MGDLIKFSELAKDPSREVEEEEVSFDDLVKRNEEKKRKLAEQRAKDNEKVKREYRLKEKK
jgi:hypothetical protein